MKKPTTQTPTEKLLSPSMMHRLSETEEGRRRIPREDIQAALAELAIVVDNDLPSTGQVATLAYPDGHKEIVEVIGYSKDFVKVNIPFKVGTNGTVRSNFALGAFEKLTKDTRTK